MASAVYALPATEDEALTYGLYMGGDIAETCIRTDRSSLPTALIFGDSFTNAVESLAYYSFDEMRSVDLRHYKTQSITTISPPISPTSSSASAITRRSSCAATTAASPDFKQGGLL